MEEVTGRPQINGKSHAIKTGIREREQWECTRQRKLEELQKVQLEKEVDECTFKPSIAPKSNTIQRRLESHNQVFNRLAQPRQCRASPSAPQASNSDCIGNRAVAFEALLDMWEGKSTRATAPAAPNRETKPFTPPLRNPKKISAASVPIPSNGNCTTTSPVLYSLPGPKHLHDRWASIPSSQQQFLQQSSHGFGSQDSFWLKSLAHHPAMSTGPPSTGLCTPINERNEGRLGKDQILRSLNERVKAAATSQSNEGCTGQNAVSRNGDQSVIKNEQADAKPKWRKLLGIDAL